MTASRRLWASLVLFILAFGVGIAWDRRWHASHPFDDFFSPPHLFIYSAFGGAMLALWLAMRAPDAEQALGPALIGTAGELPFAVPRGLALLGGAYAVLGLAGMCDMIWHSSFGLDETGWSFPHAMLGWGIALALWGFAAAAFLALPGRRHWGLRLAGWTVLLLVTSNVVSGPMGRQGTVEQIRSVAALPVLAADPAPQHTFRIYEAWNVTRGNPLFVPVSALGVALALALTFRLEPNRAVVLGAAALATLNPLNGDLRTARFFGLEADPRTWMPLPLVLAALVWLGARLLRSPAGLAWAAAGLVHGLFVAAVWKQTGPIALSGALLMPAGASLGTWIGARLAAPDRRIFGIVVALGIAVPAALGMLDLWLRLNTP